MFEEFKNQLNDEQLGANIKIIGVGGAGNNAVKKMLEDRIKGVEFIVANTDSQALRDSRVEKQIALGKKTTKGLGAGSYPEVGRKAAEESLDEIKAVVTGADLVFIAAGMGGGTGTGAAPVIAKAAKEAGAIVVAIVTTPFSFEGPRRIKNAIEGQKEMTKVVDSIIVVSNDRLSEELGEISLADSFKYADAILKQAVRTIAELIQEHSTINLDFADVKAVLEGQGPALIGVGVGKGENSAIEAAVNAIQSPILESSIYGAKSAIINIAGSNDNLTIIKAQEAVKTIKEAADSDLDIMFGITTNDSFEDQIVVSVIATGLSNTRTDLEHQSTSSTLMDETDIEQYKDPAGTREFDLNEFTSEKTTDEVFEGFSLLDDEDETDKTIEDLLG